MFSDELDSIGVLFLAVLSVTIMVSGFPGIGRALDITLLVLGLVAVAGLGQGFHTIHEK